MWTRCLSSPYTQQRINVGFSYINAGIECQFKHCGVLYLASDPRSSRYPGNPEISCGSHWYLSPPELSLSTDGWRAEPCLWLHSEVFRAPQGTYISVFWTAEQLWASSAVLGSSVSTGGGICVHTKTLAWGRFSRGVTTCGLCQAVQREYCLALNAVSWSFLS